LLFAVTVTVFLPSLRNGFVDWDDHVTIVSNEGIRGLGWEQIRWMFSSFLLGPYQPLSWISLALDYMVWGLDPVGFHLTSLLLHAANVVLVFGLATRLFALGMPSVAAASPSGVIFGASVASLLFGVHPLRVESVVWATERRDTLSALFVLLAVIAYCTRDRADAGLDHKAPFPWAAFALFLLALLSKASVVGLPIVLLLLDVFPLRRLPSDPRAWASREARPVFLEKAPFFLASLVFSGVAVYGQWAARAVRTLSESGVVERAGYAAYAAGLYLWKSVVPVRLSPLYEAPADVGSVAAGIALGGTLVLAGSLAAWRGRRRAPAFAVAWVAFLALLAPVSGIVHVGNQIAADRYTYLPCLPLGIVVGTLAARLSSRPGAAVLAWSAAVLATACLGLLTSRQIGVWRDSLTLWEHASRLAPESAIAHYGRGQALAARGRPGEAAAAYREALRIDPGYADARNNLATLLADAGQLDEALQHFLALEAADPKDAMLQYNLGLVATRLGRRDQAKARYRTALERQPALASARINLAYLLDEEGNLEGARALLSEGLASAPADTALRHALDHLASHERGPD
jgi:Tfp pilus assembly protein PilF